jgi:hypothetical protein
MREKQAMSQPPQQPPGQWGGQPGWGQQPGPGQQPGGHPQQSGYPQPGGFPQTGPQPQQYGQPQPYGQPQQYGQPAYGQPGPYGQPTGYGYPPPKKSPMPWILAGGGVVVIAVVVILVIALTGGSDTSSPEGVAKAAVAAANDNDIDALTELTCDGNRADVESQMVDPSELDPSLADVKVSFELGEVTTEGEDRATAQIKMTFENLPAEAREFLGEGTTVPLNLGKKDGEWCVEGFASITG